MRDALVMPIYEGTSQIQCLMAMKDTLVGVMRNPQAFVRKLAQARWRSVSARDQLERKVARVQQLSLSAQQHLMTKTATDKVRSLQGKPITEWPRAFFKNWDPPPNESIDISNPVFPSGHLGIEVDVDCEHDGNNPAVETAAIADAD